MRRPHDHVFSDLFARQMTRRAMIGTSLVAGGALWQGHRGTGAQTAGVTLRLAANNATSAEKAAADYRSDGVNDYVEFIAARNALPSAGGTLSLSSGTFDFGLSNVEIKDRRDIWIVGQGIDVTVVRNAPTASMDLEPFS